jgi:recombinational DNA repair ATPase RecF
MSLVKELTKKTPILLLDDIFDKLDDTRVSQLIELVNRKASDRFLLRILTGANRKCSEKD